ncbi:MAG TPA: DUF1097 domain-containing protein [Gemmatimonadales bacterium]|nr:DUF1097 domain-containing protein [Gemmatimonadales bacterium]
MDVLVALGVSIGILIAAWTYIALGTAAALPVWAGIVAWCCFFAAGGKTTGLTKTIASNVSGVFWAFVALYFSASLPGIGALSLLVGVAALFMVLQSKIPALSFIPGAFLGAATAVSVVVGAEGKFPHPWARTVVALVLGAVFGYLSEMLAGAIARKPRRAGL